jgi:predicted lipase
MNIIGFVGLAAARQLLKRYIVSPKTPSESVIEAIPLLALRDSAVLSRIAYLSPTEISMMDKTDIATIAEKNMKSRIVASDNLVFYDATENGSILGSTQAYSWVEKDARVAYLFFRGTDCPKDVLTNLDVRHKRLGKSSAKGVKVHQGFLSQFNFIEPHITEYLKKHRTDFDEIVCTGHSLGGALATLAAAFYSDDAEHTPSKNGPWTTHCHTFGCPRVGNAAFSRHFADFVPKDRHWRVFHFEDPVPMIPISFRFVHTIGNGMCLGDDDGLVKIVTRDCPWYLRWLQGAISVHLLKPIAAHDMLDYVLKLDGLTREPL